MIWIVGNKGMLGTELSQLISSADIPFTGSDREVDILDQEAMRRFSNEHRVDAIVNCAAYTAVDRAEDEPDICMRLNAEGPANLARIARTMGARFVHLSTDYVFSGNGATPYREHDPVDPQGAYGKSKAEGESRILAENPEALIVRTAWLYGKAGVNFVYTMLKLMRSREKIGVVADQAGTPTWTKDLAEAILKILRASSAAPGIYHYSGAGATSWFLFAKAIQAEGMKAGILTTPCEVVPLTTDQYPTKARRPAYSVLSKEKIIKEFELEIPEWETSLSRFITDIAADPAILSARI